MRAIICDSCDRRIKIENGDRVFTVEIRELEDIDDGTTEISSLNYEVEICESCVKRIKEEIFEHKNRPCGIGVE